jgi:hypothetical protein
METWLYAASDSYAGAEATLELARSGIIWRSYYADRQPRQSIPHVADLQVGDTIYLGYRQKGNVRLLGRMHIGQPDVPLNISPVFCEIPAPLVPEFQKHGYAADALLGRLVGIWVQDVELLDATIPSQHSRLAIVRLKADPLGDPDTEATASATLAEPSIPGSCPAPTGGLSPIAEPVGTDSCVDQGGVYVGIDVGGRTDKGFDLCFLSFGSTGIREPEFESCPYPVALPPTDQLRQPTADGDLGKLADLTYPAAARIAATLWDRLCTRQVQGVYIDSPSGFSRNQTGHGRLTEKCRYRGVCFQCTPSIATNRVHRGDWNWLVYGMVGFAACLYRGRGFSSDEWEAVLQGGLYRSTRDLRRVTVRECFPTATVSVIRERQRAGRVHQLLAAHANLPEVEAVIRYLQYGVAAVKRRRPLYDRADALVAALSSLARAFPQEFCEAERLPRHSVRWRGASGEDAREGRIAVVE